MPIVPYKKVKVLMVTGIYMYLQHWVVWCLGWETHYEGRCSSECGGVVEGCGNASFHGECVGVCGCGCGECDVCLTVTRGERPGSGAGEREG